MTIICIQSMWIIGCVLMPILFNSVLGQVTLENLRQTCMFEFPFGFTYDQLPPKSGGFCTSIGTYRRRPPPPGIEISGINMNLNYVYVYDIKLIDLASNKLLDPLSSLDDIKRVVEKQGVNVLILDFLERDFQTEIPLDIDNSIQMLYLKLKIFKRELFIGLMLPKSEPNNLELRLKDSLFGLNDLFVVASYDYEECRFNQDQAKMAKPPTDVQIENTIAIYQRLRFPLDKVFLTIEVVVKTWKNENAPFYERWSYKSMCETNPEPNRRYCTQDLENISLQAQAVRKFSLPGVFIKSIDFDDWKNTCHCTEFPAAQVIIKEINNIPKDNKLTSCTTFGQHK